jgi:hypothetical protein
MVYFFIDELLFLKTCKLVTKKTNVTAAKEPKKLDTKTPMPTFNKVKYPKKSIAKPSKEITLYLKKSRIF